MVHETPADAGAEAERREPLIPRFRVTRQERNRLILVGLAAVVLVWLLANSWDALGPFILALVLAYLMLPLVDLIARYVPRVVAILLVYAIFMRWRVGLVLMAVPADWVSGENIFKRHTDLSKAV